MDIDIDRRLARMGVGELAGFSLGPRGGGSAAGGLWRAQLGTEWHRRLREDSPEADCEVPIEGELAHRGWTFALSGRIDQLRPGGDGPVLREIKTVAAVLPAPEDVLRAEFPGYFAQLAAYVELRRLRGGETGPAELVFVEAATGILQTVAFAPEDLEALRRRLDRMVEFLETRRGARERLRGLRFRAAFAAPRPGQESVQAQLEAAWSDPAKPLLFEAPTGYGKTGVLIEFALGQLRTGRFDRVLYLTSKATGQLQVVRTLAAMTEGPADGERGVAAWHVRNKSEHCVNPVFHCVREACPYLDGADERWAESGLNRFYLDDGAPRDLPALREAGRAARICPYEITRAALAFQQFWIGDYNYVFAPSARGLFYEQPGFDPGRSLLLIDEAHNLPARAADAHSHAFSAGAAEAAGAALRRSRAPGALLLAWEAWTRFLLALSPAAPLAEGGEAEARELLGRVAELLAAEPFDHAGSGPEASGLLWEAGGVPAELEEIDLPRLWWCPRAGRLALTCLDAAADIGARLKAFGGVVLASATPGPADALGAALGLGEAEPPSAPGPEPGPRRLGELGARETRRVFAQVSRGSDLLRARESAEPPLACVKAEAPWRDRAYDVAVDLRVDTTFQQRARFFGLTARTVLRLHGAQPAGRRTAVAVFFSSYAYAESVAAALASSGAGLRAALQPRQGDLALQAAWMEASLAGADALFLILGSSFAESVDLLGGRVSQAVVVGPALPEVNAVQQARMRALGELGRGQAFRRTYQIPGMQKVNQALGRLVRSPGQAARVLLHCRRFAEPDYEALLAPEYRGGRKIATEDELGAWIGA